ncbi:B2 protein-like [Camellia sinensis]|uniref:B2 protein-like n=1 Tax=Camellia sinensis TaxID=4442 RepID=UPI001036A529|nr:B2 protein-like [Camellia sinensis]
MASNDVRMKNASRKAPDVGAIFMSNRTTIEECFKRKLFGLPHAFLNFVKEVKAGMVLFLFEFKQRKLYGVFQAVTDGSMNIVPNAYRSTGKSFPAQVQFSVLWICRPLYEHDFCDAIQDNYYATTKFNFGLSNDQVCSYSHFL